MLNQSGVTGGNESSKRDSGGVFSDSENASQVSGTRSLRRKVSMLQAAVQRNIILTPKRKQGTKNRMTFEIPQNSDTNNSNANNENSGEK